jgi:hypothetical protein
MGFPAPSKLYFAAAALFLCVVAIGLSDSGFELRGAIGLSLAGFMVTLGLKARNSGEPR